jgi:hypothetical protein
MTPSIEGSIASPSSVGTAHWSPPPADTLMRGRSNSETPAPMLVLMAALMVSRSV